MSYGCSFKALCSGILPLKNKIIKPTGKWIGLEKKIILSEVAQTQKDRYGIYSLISGY